MKESAAAASLPVVEGVPLRPGEILEFSAEVAKMSNVADVRLQVVNRANIAGQSTWHFQAFAHTANPLRMLFEMDDQFDSYSDIKTLASVQYEMRLSERGQKVNSLQRMTTTGKEPAPPNITEARVVPGTRDPLGLLEYLRTVDWSKNQEARSVAYDGHKLYDVRAQLLSSKEAVTVPAGNYTASKIGLHVLDNGVELKDAQFTLYLANNADHTPVLLDAVLPFANAHAALVSVK